MPALFGKRLQACNIEGSNFYGLFLALRDLQAGVVAKRVVEHCTPVPIVIIVRKANACYAAHARLMHRQWTCAA